MASEFDELEKEVMEDMRETYTETTIDHAMNPRNVGSMSDYDGSARITGPCGDTMEMWLKVRNNVINRITFWTDGCGTSFAAGSMLTELARGKSITQAMKINQHDVLDALGGLPEENVHCALLAGNTLKAAVRDYLLYKKEPWKKAYRKV